MNLVLVDTSVWIDLLGKQKKFKIEAESISKIGTCLPVIQEVLQGIKDDLVHQRLKESFMAFPCLQNPLSRDLFLHASDLFRSGRKRGLTIRSSVDCLIAAIAIKESVPIWHDDRDFDVIARYADLKTVKRLLRY